MKLGFSFLNRRMTPLFSLPCRTFAQEKSKNLYSLRRFLRYNPSFANVNSKRQDVKFAVRVHRPPIDPLPIPRHDYINFKVMGGNEILLNLENYEHFSNSELVSALIELAKRDAAGEHDWN